MALRGTLKDFGIADILQLIGHQGKTGVLTVKNGDQQVDISFAEGNVVRAESSTRDRRDLLGHMLVRAEVLSEEQVNRALEQQQRTLKRLGQILVESGALERKVLATFTRLQTTETIYRLFFWTNGSYEFHQREVLTEPDVEPLRSESILMEGFRQLDEWPSIRRRVTSYGMLFERLQELDALAPSTGISDELNLDDAFSERSGSGNEDALANIGQNERTVFQLVAPDRDVQKLIDLSRLGEFETCKALERLIAAGFLRGLPQARPRAPSAEATVGGISARRAGRVRGVVMRAFLSVALVFGVAFGLRSLSPVWRDIVAPREPWGHVDVSLQAEIARGQMHKIERALAMYEATVGIYPATLDELVTGRLLESRDLRFPWRERYTYYRDGAGYVLLRPLY